MSMGEVCLPNLSHDFVLIKMKERLIYLISKHSGKHPMRIKSLMKIVMFNNKPRFYRLRKYLFGQIYTTKERWIHGVGFIFSMLVLELRCQL